MNDSLLFEIQKLVAEISEQSLRWFRHLDSVDNKKSDGFDPVTEADRHVELELRKAIKHRFPDDTITGEEFESEGSGSRRWTIDPIDGTGAFVAGQPMWGTLVGLVENDAAVAGWMHLPILDESYAGFGQGSYITYGPASKIGTGTERIETNESAKLAKATLLCTHPSMFSPGSEIESFNKLLSAIKTHRFSGDCVNYALLCAGHVDLVVENQLKDHDIVPLIALIEGAGGVVTNLDGKSPIDGGYAVAAANQNLHQAALEVLNS